MVRPNLLKLLADQPLRGSIVELSTLAADDFKELAARCLDPEVWRSTIAKIRTEQELRAYLQRGLDQLASGNAVPLLMRLAKNGTAVGSTRLALSFDPDQLEIGWTFVAPEFHRRGVNVEAKLLLLRYCFTDLRCRKVVFKVAAGNERSKAALDKIGAVPLAAGDIPASVSDPGVEWFQLSAEDWPARRRDLERRVEASLAATAKQTP